jgi:hypothetical protein
VGMELEGGKKEPPIAAALYKYIRNKKLYLNCLS